MTTLKLFKTLGPIDLRNVSRDALLVWIPLIPLVMALLLRLAVPAVAAVLQTRFGFDLSPYYGLIMSNFVVLAPTVVGMVVGFLLLDERDDRTLQALQVTPVPLRSYLLYRLGAPMAVGTLVTLAGYPVAGLTPLPVADLAILALLSSFNAPLMALTLVAFAENKVAGFAVLKMVNAVMLLPVLVYFVDSPVQNVAGVIPSYWILKAFWLASEGRMYLLAVLLGIVTNIVALLLLQRRFYRSLHS